MSLKRATGWAHQADPAVPEAAADWWNQYGLYPTIEDVATQETLEFELNSRATEGAVQPGTLYSRVQAPFAVDSREWPRYLTAGAGYAFGSGNHTFTFGNDPASWLTMWRYDGISGEMRRVPGLLLNSLELAMDFTAGTVRSTLEFLGQMWTKETALSISYSAYATHKLPFAARQAVLLYNGAAFCPLVATLRLNNNVAPQYCGPSTDPTTGDPVYLSPTELSPGKAAGSLDITARYLGYSGSILSDSRSLTEHAVQLKFTDPTGTPTTHTWTLPRWQPLPGQGLDSNMEQHWQRQSASGPLLVSAGEIATLVVAGNGVTNYLA